MMGFTGRTASKDLGHDLDVEPGRVRRAAAAVRMEDLRIAFRLLVLNRRRRG